ncbi:xaa-Arg dipeptidase-like [Uloborus diversus]|uniref:xaa-Arg dipeptidase-like n=1 Tax=Uloborus diversus TaxID=327109 RepID=UPI00240A466F|nr:xaa-Arg dipeptidase-like [Uloborus diversus]
MSSTASRVIRENSLLLGDLSRKIWEHPELNFQEKYAHDLLTSVLEEWGFQVQKNYLLPTAFKASFESKKDGPTIAVLCEYDALPEMGHACGHNLIAEIGIAAGIAVKTCMEEDEGIAGKIVVLGTPAEEGGGGKILMIEKGAFKGIDVVLMAHPQAVDRLYPLIVDMAMVTVNFFTKAETDPWSGQSAVDAAVVCYNNVATMRRCFDRKWRLSGVVFKDQDRRYCESAVSTDIGNVSHVVPSIQPEFSIGSGEVNHTPEFATVAGSSDAQAPTLIIAEALAHTVVELMTNPKLMKEIKTEFDEDPMRDASGYFRQTG